MNSTKQCNRQGRSIYDLLFNFLTRKYFLLAAVLAFAISNFSGINEAFAKKKGKGKSQNLIQSEFRTIDGSNNNKKDSSLGQAGIKLIRKAKVDYADGKGEVNEEGLPGARAISNAVVAQTGSILNDRGLSDMVWQWGQFLDHDIDLTDPHEPEESLPISIPAGDPSFDPTGTGTQTLPFSRSEFELNRKGVRQQVNSITAYIDASNVYGSDDERAAALRSLVDGKLKTSAAENLLPFNTFGLANAGGANNTSLFIAGDVRANENVGLLSMHTLFVREHNRKADEILAADPDLTDEEVYQRARRHVGALMQKITYSEFLPALLGDNALSKYKGYKRNKNPGIMNEFSTAAYRFGHSTISPQILRMDNDGNTVPEGNLALRDAFFRPDQIADSDDIGELLKGLASQQMQEVDNFVIDDLRNFLFGAPGSGGLDLPSLNIQRGRDHGLPRYNKVRKAFGLKKKKSFDDVSSNAAVVAQLQSVYSSVDDIDAWVGILAEDHLTGSSAGQLMNKILKRQFQRLRDCDRFWYQRALSSEDLAEVEATTLSDVIKRNTQITNIQDNVFLAN